MVLNPKAIVGDSVKTRQAGERKGAAKGDDDKGSKDSKDGGKRPAKEAAPKAGNSDAGDKAQLSPEERQKRMQEKMEKYRQASPEERKQMLQQEKPEFRDRIKDRLEQQGIKVD